MRLGFSAKTLSPAPYVHFSFPGSVLTSFGQPFTTSYAPVRSSPPTAPATAANPIPGFACPSTVERLPEILTPTTTPMTNIKDINPIFFMPFLRKKLFLGIQSTAEDLQMPQGGKTGALLRGCSVLIHFAVGISALILSQEAYKGFLHMTRRMRSSGGFDLQRSRSICLLGR